MEKEQGLKENEKKEMNEGRKKRFCFLIENKFKKNEYKRKKLFSII